MNQVEIYKHKDDQIEIKVHFENETVWLSQKTMAELFGRDSDTIRLHVKNINEEQEIEENPTTEDFSAVQDLKVFNIYS